MIQLYRGDITDLAVDAIVNAANSALWMGSGVAGTIKLKGGAEIEREALAQGPIAVGEAVVTGAGRLAARYVIHAAAVGSDLVADAGTVQAATRNALRRAAELGLHSIAFPALGAGMGGYSPAGAARVMVAEVRRHLTRGSSLSKVLFAVRGEGTYGAFREVLERSKVVCLGDSITYGYPYGPHASWVARVGEALGRPLVNAGVVGHTTGQMLARFVEDVVAERPAYVVILGGTNDAWQNLPLEEVRANIRAMVEMSFREGICPVLGLPVPLCRAHLSGIFDAEDVDAAAQDLDLLRDWIRTYAEEEGLPYVDFCTPLRAAEGGGKGELYSDAGHPNLEGYRVLAEAALPVLARLP